MSKKGRNAPSFLTGGEIMRKTIDLLKTHPVLTGIIAVTIGVTATKLYPTDKLYMAAFLRIVLTMAMCMFVYLISGEKSFEKCHTTTGYVYRIGFISILMNVFFLIFALLPLLMGVNKLVDGWYYRLIIAFVLAIFVGLFEELMFRVIINDALLYAFRNSKHIFVWIAFVSSFVFGFVHVIGVNIFASPMSFTGAMLKTISTALGGFCWLMLYWKTRNLWGIALLHATDDLVSFVPRALTNIVDGQLGGADAYVNSGPDAAGLYVLMIVFSLVAVIYIWKKVGRTIDYEEIRRTW